MELMFYNSLTKKKEKFTKSLDETVTMYTCGPTVYNYAHIGNFRAYIFEDILKRTLMLRGYSVKHVMNITDVEDKIIKAVSNSGKKLSTYTEYYTKSFLEDIDKLNIIRADVYPKATDHIDEIVELTNEITKSGIAYRGDDGSIYFSVKKYKNYGQLQKIDFQELKEGVRINQDEYTKDFFGDFALWKSWNEDDGDVYWNTEIGKGRPGWHIECSVMCLKHLTNAYESGHLDKSKFKTIDIHCGGIDNLFPHHENEIAQTESVTNKKFVEFWMHCEHLNVEGKKMSKSSGNFYTLRELLDKGYSWREIRYVLVSAHYKQKLNFSFDGLNAAVSALSRIDNFVNNLKLKVDNSIKSDESSLKFILEMSEEYKKSLYDDLNISSALAKLFNIVKHFNKVSKISIDCYDNIINALKMMDEVLGLIFVEKETKIEISEKEIEELIRKRDEFKKIKQYAEADEIRNVLNNKGIEIKDTKNGTTWLRK